MADKKAAESKATKATDSKATKAAESKASKTYHISKRKEDNRWQVKAEGADKALKLFLTQDEAIAFAKKTAGNQDARIVIHKADGSFRRLTY